MRCRRHSLGLSLVVTLCIVKVAASAAAAPNPCMPMPVMFGGIAASPLDPTTSTLTVASLNIAGQARIAEALVSWIYDRSVDVLLLQEVGDASSGGETLVAALTERLGLRYVYAPADQFDSGHTQGLAIVSRYELNDVRVEPLNYFHLRFRSRCRIALAATAITPAAPVRLVNVHLDTRINSKNRLTQLAPAVEALRIFNGRGIIGGDLNTMNIRWFRTMWPLPYVERQSAAVHASMSGSGFHTPFVASPPTFRFLGIPMRLDWLYLRDLEPVEWGVDHVRFTDHRGVWVRAKGNGETRVARSTTSHRSS